MIDLQQLKTELLTDPNGYGYAPLIADTNNPALAAMLNLQRVAIQVKRSTINPVDILESVDIADFITTATVIQCSWFESLTQYPQISLINDDGSDNRIMKNLKALIPAGGQGSRGRISALSLRAGSRIEQLFGLNTVVSVQEVIDAQRI